MESNRDVPDFLKVKLQADRLIQINKNSENGLNQALHLYQATIKECINNPDPQFQDVPYKCYLQAGLIMYEKNQFEAAIKNFDTVISQNKSMLSINAAAHFYRGNAYQAQGRYQKAVLDFESAITIYQNDNSQAAFPKTRHIIRALLNCSKANQALGYLNNAQKNCNDALKCYEQFNQEYGAYHIELIDLIKEVTNQKAKLSKPLETDNPEEKMEELQKQLFLLENQTAEINKKFIPLQIQVKELNKKLTLLNDQTTKVNAEKKKVLDEMAKLRNTSDVEAQFTNNPAILYSSKTPIKPGPNRLENKNSYSSNLPAFRGN